MIHEMKPNAKANTTRRVQGTRTPFPPIKEKIDIHVSRPMLPHQVNSPCVHDNKYFVPTREGEY